MPPKSSLHPFVAERLLQAPIFLGWPDLRGFVVQFDKHLLRVVSFISSNDIGLCLAEMKTQMQRAYSHFVAIGLLLVYLLF